MKPVTRPLDLLADGYTMFVLACDGIYYPVDPKAEPLAAFKQVGHSEPDVHGPGSVHFVKHLKSDA